MLDRERFQFFIVSAKSPLTLALSQRERGLIAVFGRGTPTCNSALNSGFEKPTNRLPLPRERAGVRAVTTQINSRTPLGP